MNKTKLIQICLPITAIFILIGIIVFSIPDADAIVSSYNNTGIISPPDIIGFTPHSANIIFIWNPEDKELRFNPWDFRTSGSNQTYPIHDTYLHWDIYNSTFHDYYFIDDDKPIVTGIDRGAFWMINLLLEENIEQDKVINDLENKIELLEDKLELLEDKLGKQGKRLKALEAQLIP